MSSENDVILLADTNAVYKLFFFSETEVISKTDIDVPGVGRIEFHPIVQDEIDSHLTALRVLRQSGIPFIPGSGIPRCLDQLSEEQLNRLDAFVAANLSKRIEPVDTHSTNFQASRRVYENERRILQSRWKARSIKGRKVVSQPSMEDYSILYSAEERKMKIVTNDEILFSVAESILDEGYTYRTEDIIKAILRADPELRPKIEKTLVNLEFVGETILTHLIFSSQT